jgi:dihydrofolate synthase/folylpolyglutamate synthase
MLASVLQSSGYKTGLYTSPHLKDFTERIKINGQHVDQDFIIEFVNRIKPLIEEISPSFFEITVAMAFEYYAQQQIDVAVIEVGLGGRLDSTNVITPVVSVITNIGFDHKDILGNTLREIASEKAGIIKSNVPVVISERQPEIETVFIEKAKKNNATLTFANDEYRIQHNQNSLEVIKNDELYLSDLDLPLKGNYQAKNIKGVLKAVDVLRENGLKISKEDLIAGLEQTVTQTGLKGRWQKLGNSPLIICDTGHNSDGIGELVKQIGQQKYSKLFFLLGMVKDKEPDEVLKLLPADAYYYFCQAKIPRAMEAELLMKKAEKFGLKGEVEPEVNHALEKAKKRADKDDFIFIGGSTFVVAEINDL